MNPNSPIQEKTRSDALQSESKSKIRSWALVAGVCILLASYSILRRGTAPEISLTFRDKIEHFLVYAMLGTLILKSLPSQIRGTSRWLLAFALASAFGFFEEILQHYNPSRTGDPLDWFADSLGALFAVVAYKSISLYRRIVDWTPIS